jgi:hypothetical protein
MKGKLYLALLEPSEVKRCRSAPRVNINDKYGKGSLLDLTENQPAGWASLLWKKGKLNLACDEPSEVKRCRSALRVNINDLDSQGLLLEDLTGNQLEGWAISFREGELNLACVEELSAGRRSALMRVNMNDKDVQGSLPDLTVVGNQSANWVSPIGKGKTDPTCDESHTKAWIEICWNALRFSINYKEVQGTLLHIENQPVMYRSAQRVKNIHDKGVQVPDLATGKPIDGLGGSAFIIIMAR